MIPITSTELNYLIFRYLHESGFTHSAFALGYEAGINKSTIDGNLVPPGALVRFVQKGIQYLELEANNDADMDEDFSFLQPLDLITKDISELQKIIKEKKENLQKTRHREKDKDDDEFDNEHERGLTREREKEHEQEHAREKEKEHDREHTREREKEREREHAREKEKEHEREHAREREKEKQQKEKERDQDRERLEKEREREKGKVKEQMHDDATDVRHGGDKMSMVLEENRAGPEPMEIEVNEVSTSSAALPGIIPTSDVMILEGHSSEVFVCAWSPSGPVLASGAGDSTARIWTIGDGPCSSNLQTGPLNSAVLKHFKGRTNEKNKDVTTLDWNGEGTLLATGSYDGQARIWNRDAMGCGIRSLLYSLNGHRDPVYTVAFSANGEYLASGSLDKCMHVWSVKEGRIVKTYTGNGGIFEVCWNKEGDKIAACFATNVVCILDFRM